jgi:hypothetical protein
MLPQRLQHHPGRFHVRPRPCRVCRDAFTRTLVGYCRRCMLLEVARQQVRLIQLCLRHGDGHGALRETLALAITLALPRTGTDRPTKDELTAAAAEAASVLRRREV